MKLKTLLGIFMLGIVALGASVFAFNGYGNGQGSAEDFQQPVDHEKGDYSEQINDILLNGTYEDLLALREELSIDVLRKVQSEEDFDLMKEKRLYMIENGIEPGSKPRLGNGQGFGKGRHNMQGSQKGNCGNCPYLN